MTFPKDKRFMWIVWYGVALIAVCVIGVVATSWYFNFQPQLPFGITTILRPLLPSPVPTDTGPAKPKNTTEAFIPSLRKATLTKTGNTLYTLHGTFTDKPKFVNDNLMGMFVIDNDTTKTPIKVIMTARTGTIYVGRFTNSITGNSTWKYEKTTVLESLLDAKKPVELKIIVSPSFGRDMAKVFNAILTDGWSFPRQFVIVPQMVGVVVE